MILIRLMRIAELIILWIAANRPGPEGGGIYLAITADALITAVKPEIVLTTKSCTASIRLDNDDTELVIAMIEVMSVIRDPKRVFSGVCSLLYTIWSLISCYSKRSSSASNLSFFFMVKPFLAFLALVLCVFRDLAISEGLIFLSGYLVLNALMSDQAS